MFNFRDLSRVTKTFRLEIGPLRARGVPAILLGVSTVIAAGGFARLLAQNPTALTETIREATRFIASVRGEAPALKSADDR
ncbi:MAG: hypothetical protein JO359_13265 [Candidatus Eremiobacteraeota bacterium]|nr:hypothetical protein [Candidatus Eremiobacteraeota bacterium]